MARIPKEELDRLKREISLQRLAEECGIELKRRGKDLVGLCPFHDDKNPSLSINPEMNVFHCFGCGAKGSVIDWVMKTEGVALRKAVELLRSGADLSSASLKMADLSGADFSGANLERANLVGAALTGTTYTDAYLEGAIWTNGKTCGSGSIGRCVQ